MRQKTNRVAKMGSKWPTGVLRNIRHSYWTKLGISCIWHTRDPDNPRPVSMTREGMHPTVGNLNCEFLFPCANREQNMSIILFEF
jgi:hypothetical protein